MIGAIVQFTVPVNYNMVDYLPEDSPSLRAVELMEEEFAEPMPNTRVMVRDISVTEALAYKEKLLAIDGVSHVIWLDDAIDIKVPLEVANADTVASFYKNRDALFSVTIEDGTEVNATDAIYELIGSDNAIEGEAVNTAISQKMTGKESLNATMLLVPIVIIILILSTNSWLEPVFFLTAIGVSVLINLGTNVFLGDISFITQSVAPILQLAVSLDYAIFLLHSFSDFRKQVNDPAEAMQLAMKRSFPAIIASASTTFFGFTALTVMNFEIGADLGLNLLKGIALSFISVMVFLPALTLMFYHWIDRTTHRPFIPDFKNIGKRVLKMRGLSLLILLALIVPAFLGQSHTAFQYGVGEQPEHTRAGKDQAAIQEVFGKNVPMVLLVPTGNPAKEEKLVQALEPLPHVTSVVAYVNLVSPAVPAEFLDESVTKPFYSDDYARITLYTETDTEGELAFSLIEKVHETAGAYYDETHLLGESVTLFDIKNIVQKDNTLVNWLTVITIALVLILTFKSIIIPAILLVTIQAAVWINLAVPYFTDVPLVYIGYLLISTIQLAATVDYAILFTEAYGKLRKELPAMEAIRQTIDGKIFAIFVSASILSSVGFILWLTSSNPIVGSVGLLLGRGALLAFIMVVFVLPALLLVLDRLIEKTTLKANFYKGK